MVGERNVHSELELKNGGWGLTAIFFRIYGIKKLYIYKWIYFKRFTISGLIPTSSCKIIALFLNIMKVGKKLDKTCNALHEFIQIKCPFRYKNYL